ncbi:hypothetical protein SAMN04490188_5689 [Pseudomonas kilonensis]|uniref:Uncharacterized protein n=1 Tax=Pseudomonas kilonensis TaxID=132476 RepID=A0ABY0ZIX1_9PSED|nr:hypothetical protein SAMN04490188_5689 [Pseudomonas kilonensis]
MGCKGQGAQTCGFWCMGAVASVLTCFGVYIRYFGNGGWLFRSYSGSLSKSAKVTKALMPHHSAPRLGSVCPHSGIAPWAAAKGHPWPSAATSASMPRCPLRNTCVRPAWLTGRRDQRPPRGGLTAGLVLGGDRVSPVGAGLLAKAVGRFVVMLDVPASSRASSLPQVILGVHESCVHRRPLWERACSRWRWVGLW